MGITFCVEKEVLERAVTKIISVCERAGSEGKNTLPHFFHIKMEGYGTALKLSAGNSIRHIEVLIPEISEHERFCFGVYGGYFYKILKALPDGKLTFSLSNVCYVHNNVSTLKFQILGPDQFPSIPPRVEHEWWAVDYKELFSRLKRITYCIDPQSIVPRNYIKAVCITDDYFICTDHKRMSAIPNGIVPLPAPVLLPAESVASFLSLFSDIDSGYVFADNSEMFFSQQNIYASTRLLGYDAPRFERVIPKGPCLSCDAAREGLLMALKRALIVAKRGGKGAEVSTLVFSHDKILLSFEHQGFGINESISVKYDGPQTAVNLNLYFLYQAIKNTLTDMIRIEMRGDNSPIVITDQKEFHKNVIMPVVRT